MWMKETISCLCCSVPLCPKIQALFCTIFSMPKVLILPDRVVCMYQVYFFSFCTGLLGVADAVLVVFVTIVFLLLRFLKGWIVNFSLFCRIC